MLPIELDKDLVGVESRVKEIESLLSNGSKGVHILGIWGIGGIGKTTIAHAVFDKFSNHFDGSCFLQNIREECEKKGLLQLQREFLSILLRDENLKIVNSDIKYHFGRLSRMKVLITFDDVTRPDQVESLVGRLDWFMPGSLIIITTRDKQILQNYDVKNIYKMEELENVDAFKLFNRCAFKQEYPDADYKELPDKVLQYAQGVPLALKVLGSFLSGRSKGEWNSEIEKLKRIPDIDIQKVLKISYDDLDDKIQNIFLDIACFLKDVNRNFALEFLDACGFYAEIGLRVLVDRCLIIISDDKITMHDLLQEMGRDIVRRECIDDPGKRSRLCHIEEILEVLRCNTETEAIQGISLNMSKDEEISFNFNNLKKMSNLRFLKIFSNVKSKIEESGYDSFEKRYLQWKIFGFDDKGYIFPKLRYLYWDGYPLKSLPIHGENLVSLALYCSKVEQLWDGVQNLVNLKEIELAGCEQLTKLPDLSKAQNLEILMLHGCSNLVNSYSSVRFVNTLGWLGLFNCYRLNLPRSIRSESLESLCVSGRSNLKRLPEISFYNLKWLDLCGSPLIKELPSSMWCQSRLVSLYLHYPSINSLPSSFYKLKSVHILISPIARDFRYCLTSSDV
ncbi:putative disease resistance protein (TIR-NBS-LRR class) [Melia azedarach]|uniref:Disease resistance protein (TIR-NBS-LRR class) n=2 Tax=Melia azedarach TaxID=155640 RepID=A0ACC1YCT9_MELAZ|nr:putative disease resistance protein (TIR-NBS-LRR class) [Melia azedarach]KAJ4721615.1 putative disease resistance protein (TIR-NBS-LRR class) [Melia azedarach]